MIDYKAVVEHMIDKAKMLHVPVELIIEDTRATIKFYDKLFFSESYPNGLTNEQFARLLDQLMIHIAIEFKEKISYRSVLESLVAKLKSSQINAELKIDETHVIFSLPDEPCLEFVCYNSEGIRPESYKQLLEQMIIHLALKCPK